MVSGDVTAPRPLLHPLSAIEAHTMEGTPLLMGQVVRIMATAVHVLLCPLAII